MLSKVSDIIHAFFGTHKEGALPVFEQLLPHFVRLLVVDSSMCYVSSRFCSLAIVMCTNLLPVFL